jgi:hypothetical protein
MSSSRSILMGLLGLCLALPAGAQGLPEGVTATGLAEVGLFRSGDSGAVRFAFTDIDVSLGASATGGVPYGLDAGIYGQTSEDGTSGLLFLALSYRLPNGAKLSLGAPRSAFDSVARSRMSASQGILGNFVGESLLVQRNYFATGTPLGARYEQEIGPGFVAASVHRGDADDLDTSYLAVGGAWRAGDWTAEAALERTDIPGEPLIGNGKIALAADLGRLGFGTMYHVVKVESESLRGWESFVTYAPVERLELTGTFQSFAGDPTSVLGVAAKYRFSQYGFTRIGAVDAPQDRYQLTVGLEF